MVTVFTSVGKFSVPVGVPLEETILGLARRIEMRGTFRVFLAREVNELQPQQAESLMVEEGMGIFLLPGEVI